MTSAARMVSILLLATLIGGGAGASQGANVVVRFDSLDTASRGQFEAFDAYLSHGGRALRSRGPASFSFMPRLPEAGYYRVYAWWPTAADSSGRVRYTVDHRHGRTHLAMDQRMFGGQWNSLGTFAFDPGGKHGVEVSTVAGARALVDAVRFEYTGPSLSALEIETEALPPGEVGDAYGGRLTALGGVPPYRWEVATPLPDGLVLDPDSGVIAGTPTTAAAYSIRVVARDARSAVAAKDLAIDVEDTSPEPAATGLETGGALAVASAPTAAATSGPDLGALLDILEAMPAGNWARVNLNSFSEVWTPAALRPLVGASNPTPAKIIGAWSSFAWDTNRGDLWIYGGGHANYSGNDVYRWRGTTRMWERASLPSGIRQDDLGIWQALDGPDAAPPSAHTYENNIFLPIIDRFLVLGGAAYNNGGAYQRAATATTKRTTGPYLFDPNRADANAVGGTTGSHVQRVAPYPEITGARMWQNRDIYANLPESPLAWSHIYGQTAYAEENGRDVVYIVARSGGSAQRLYRYVIGDVNDPRTDTWQVMGIQFSGPTDQGTGAHDPVERIFVRTTGSSTSPFYYWDLNLPPGTSNRAERITYVDPGGAFAAAMAATSFRLWGMDFDHARRRFVLWSGFGEVWTLTPPAVIGPTGWVVAKEPVPSSATPGSVGTTGVLGKWKYIPNLGAFMALNGDTAGNVWLYKPLGWQAPAGGNRPPTVALTAPAPASTFAPGQPVTMIATAADPDGSISAVRFRQGAAVVGEVPMAPYRLDWVPPAPGAYSLTAVAIDNQGASTTSAPVAITVSSGGTPGTVVLRQGLEGYTGVSDTYLSSYHPAARFGASARLLERSTRYNMLVRFRIFQSEGGPVPDGAQIQSAALRIYKSSAYDHTYRAHRLLRDWSEAQATWNESATGVAWSVPGAQGLGTDLAAAPDGEGSVGWSAGWLSIDVTAGVEAMSSGTANRGWRIVPVSGYNYWREFHSSDYTTDPTRRPEMSITYSP